MTSITSFFREVRVEMGKVSWPSRRQLILYTLVVLGLSFFIAIYLGALGALFTNLLTRFITP